MSVRRRVGGGTRRRRVRAAAWVPVCAPVLVLAAVAGELEAIQAAGPGPARELAVTLVGNAGVLLSDGETALLVDLPYESGAFGYETYEADALRPPGRVVAVVTHHHRDHFDPAAFSARPGWEVVGAGEHRARRTTLAKKGILITLRGKASMPCEARYSGREGWGVTDAEARDPRTFLPLSAPVLNILLALGRDRLHPYGIMQAIDERTGGKAVILPGTLYTSIQRMLEQGLVEDAPDRPDPGTDDRRRRYYRLTELGRRVAAAEVDRLSVLIRVARDQRLVPDSADGGGPA